MARKQAGTFKRPFIHGILGLAILNLFLFGDALFDGQGRVLSSSQTDLYLHFVAWRQFAFEQLRQGHLALWNPYYLCGAPFLGNFESALLYPPNWLHLFLPMAMALNIGIVLHVFLSGLFTYLWAYHRGLHPLASFASGTIFMFGGAYFLHLYAGHLPNLCAMAWIPLLFLAIDGWIEELSIRWILLGIFAVSMQILAGHPQYVYFTAIIAVFYTAMRLFKRRNKLKIAGGLLGLYTGATFLTAAQLWTGLQAVSECGRSMPLEYNAAGSFSFPPQNLITLILPEFFGNLSTVHYWSQWFLWEVSLFVGVTALFLILIAIFSTRRDRWRWPAITALVAFLFALGAYTPLYRLIYDLVPLFKGLRGICKFDIFVSLFLALLAGIGLDHILRSKGIPGWLPRSALTAGIGLCGMGLLIFASARQGSEGLWAGWFTSIQWLARTIQLMDPAQAEAYSKAAGANSALSLWIGGGTCLLLFFLTWARRTQRHIGPLLTGFLVLELFLFARSNRPLFSLTLLQDKFEAISKALEGDPGEYRVYGTASASLVTGKPDIWEDEPMILGRYGRFVCYSQGIPENKLFSTLPIFQRFHPVFGMMRLKYRVLEEQGRFQAYPMPFRSLPRMLLLNEWEALSEAQRILPLLFDPRFDPARKVYLEEAPDPVPVSGKVRGHVEWKDLSTDEVEITADVPTATLLLITDNYSKGWRVTPMPDSAQARYEMMPANYFLRAIPLSAGKHRFIMEYKPRAYAVGKWVSLLSCLVYVGILVLRSRSRTTLK